MATDPQVFELKCGLQTYPWGKLGETSMAAMLKASADPNFKIESNKNYAELWMGTHPNSPSMVIQPGVLEKSLWEWVHEHPDALGSEVKQYFRGMLPFLFKVLSVRTSLSVQAHPHKVLAEQLNQTLPDLYRDPNHKPELAIALTEFMGLCGFRPVDEISGFLQKIEEFRTAVGQQKAIKLITASRSWNIPLQREALKECFSSMIEREDKVPQQQLAKLVARVHDMKERQEDLHPVEGEIILKLNHEFPGDIGAFCVYFLNVVRLEPGEAMFLEANMPHAYLSGDCMECSACSDNVVRAGLTHKMVDKHRLVEMLDYKCRRINETKFMGFEDDTPAMCTTIFRPEVPDFGVTRYKVHNGTENFTIGALDSASMLIVVQGEGSMTNPTMAGPLKLRAGTVFFMAAGQEASVAVHKDGMLIFRAYAGLLPLPYDQYYQGLTEGAQPVAPQK